MIAVCAEIRAALKYGDKGRWMPIEIFPIIYNLFNAINFIGYQDFPGHLKHDINMLLDAASKYQDFVAGKNKA